MVTYQVPNKAMIADETVAVAASPRADVKYAVEAIGTFCLVFTVGAAVRSASPLAPLGIGAVLWVYLVAQVLAGIAAGVTFLALNHDDK